MHFQSCLLTLAIFSITACAAPLPWGNGNQGGNHGGNRGGNRGGGHQGSNSPPGSTAGGTDPNMGTTNPNTGNMDPGAGTNTPATDTGSFPVTINDPPVTGSQSFTIVTGGSIQVSPQKDIPVPSAPSSPNSGFQVGSNTGAPLVENNPNVIQVVKPPPIDPNAPPGDDMPLFHQIPTLPACTPDC